MWRIFRNSEIIIIVEKSHNVGYGQSENLPTKGMNKNIWKWSNKCFGILEMIGSFLYLLLTLIVQLLGKDQFSNEINKYAILYIFLSIIVTEVFTFVRSRRSR